MKHTRWIKMGHMLQKYSLHLFVIGLVLCVLPYMALTFSCLSNGIFSLTELLGITTLAFVRKLWVAGSITVFVACIARLSKQEEEPPSEIDEQDSTGERMFKQINNITKIGIGMVVPGFLALIGVMVFGCLPLATYFGIEAWIGASAAVVLLWTVGWFLVLISANKHTQKDKCTSKKTKMQ